MSALVFVGCRGCLIKVTEANERCVFALGHRMNNTCVAAQGRARPRQAVRGNQKDSKLAPERGFCLLGFRSCICIDVYLPVFGYTYLFTYCVYKYAHVWAIAHVWRSEGSLRKQVCCLPCGCRGLSSGYPALHQTPLPTELALFISLLLLHGSCSPGWPQTYLVVEVALDL